MGFPGLAWYSTTAWEAYTAEMNFLAVLEPGSLKARCLQFGFLPRPLPLACRRPPSLWVLTLSSLCVGTPRCLCESTVPLRIRTPVRLDYGPLQQPHFNLITPLKALFPNKVTFWGMGVRPSTCELFLQEEWWGHSSDHNTNPFQKPSSYKYLQRKYSEVSLTPQGWNNPILGNKGQPISPTQMGNAILRKLSKEV